MSLPRTTNDPQPRQLRLEATTTLDLEAAGEGGTTLPRFRMVAYTGTPMRVAGWRQPVVIDLAGLSIPSQTRPIRFGHNPLSGVGHTDAVRVEGGQLIATGVVSRDTPEAREVVTSAKNGFPWQASVGASVEEYEVIKDDQQVLVNGQSYTGPLIVVRKATLGEISFVDLGADNKTSASIAAMQWENHMNDDRTIQDKPSETAAEVIARAKRERERCDAIRALVEEAASVRGADLATLEGIAAKAEQEGWTVQQTELAILRATRPRVPTPKEPTITRPVLECALAMAMGVSDETLAKDRDYGERVVEAAWPMRRAGLRGVIAAALHQLGRHAPHGGSDLYRTVLDVQAAGGFSTINVPGIIGASANKLLLQSFLAVQATYDIIAEQRDFANFHAHDIYRLDHLGEFARVPSDGELKHGHLAETQYSNQLSTYGQMLTLPRTAIINDDLGAFEQLIESLARKARLAAEKALYLLVCEVSDSFYTTARNNRHTTNPLGVAGLSVAEAAMLGQADAGGDPIYATPRYLLVPPALRWLADTLYTSATIQTTTSVDKGRPVDNPYRGRFEVVSSPYLAASSIPGSSSTTWYLLADPSLIPAFQIAYLDGQRSPVIETADAEFSVLGMSMRCYWDFGVARLDYRGASKSTA